MCHNRLNTYVWILEATLFTARERSMICRNKKRAQSYLRDKLAQSICLLISPFDAIILCFFRSANLFLRWTALVRRFDVLLRDSERLFVYFL